MARFTLPRDVFYGADSLEMLKTLSGKRAMVVTGGGSMRKFGVISRVTEHLEAAGMTVEVFEPVEPDPSVETVLRGAAAMRAFEPDWIVAVGGGSAIDAAKAMWVFYEHPQTAFTDLLTPFSFPVLRTRARFAAIPSTSGTASEVTAFSVITDAKTGVKYPLADYQITPDVAILDPALAKTMPRQLAEYTGMDALTHAVEAYVSTLHGPFTDPLALAAIRTVFADLPASADGDPAARERVHYAQCMAGMAFSNALLGIVHSLAHKTGAAFSTGHIPHGCANAIYLPYVIRFNARDVATEKRYADIARYCQLEGETDAALVQALVHKICTYNQTFGIPATLRAFGVDEREFRDKARSIADLAVRDACTSSNPRAVTEAQMEQLLWAVYDGGDVEF